MRVASIQIRANDLKNFRSASERLEQMVKEAAKSHDLILVPECAFPAYFLHRDEGNLPSILAEGEQILTRIKEIAIQSNCYIAYGYCEKEGDLLYNTALLIDRQGNEVVKKRKSFLWHFDDVWFCEGNDVAVADTDFGRVGLVVCADARMPEIIRMAALEGAELIIDLANLTATGPDISALHNAQSAYMLSVRALENQVWLAVSDKWGVEANSITYAGRSGVFAPDGTCVYQAGSDRDEIVSVEIPTDSNGRIVRTSSINDVARRPELYEILVQPTDSLPITNIMKESVVPSDITPYVTVASGNCTNAEDQEYFKMVRRLANQGSKIICMPPIRVDCMEHLDMLSDILPSDVLLTVTIIDETNVMTTYVITNSGIQSSYTTLHNCNPSTEVRSPFIYDTKWGRIGIMHDIEALLPEWSRSLMLLGADCVIWPNQMAYPIGSNISRTRAAENRIYVVSAQSSNDGVSQIVDPNGLVVASALKSEKVHACGTLTPFINSRVKEIVPGTNVVTNRHPHAYWSLVK